MAKIWITCRYVYALEMLFTHSQRHARNIQTYKDTRVWCVCMNVQQRKSEWESGGLGTWISLQSPNECNICTKFWQHKTRLHPVVSFLVWSEYPTCHLSAISFLFVIPLSYNRRIESMGSWQKSILHEEFACTFPVLLIQDPGSRIL